MSTQPEAASRPVRRFFRRGFPILVLLLAAAATAVFQLWPSADWEPFHRNAGTMVVTEILILLLVIWVLFLSGLKWWVRLATLAAAAVLAFAVIRDMHFSGDMVPVVHFRWERDQNQKLADHRSAAGRAETAVAADLSGDRPTDWPEFRGRKRDGLVQGPPLAREWSADPPREVWRQPCGGGYAAFAVANNLLVTIEQRGDDEAVVGYDTATGKERWVHSYPAHFKEALGGPGPRATPTIKDGEVYSLGATGTLVRLSAATGELKWSVNILEGNANIQWAMSGSPLVYDNLVVVNPGVQQPAASGRAVVAYDRATGKPVWQSGNAPAGYSSPMLATLAGRRQVLLLDASGLSGYDAADGKELWRFPWEAYNGINVAQPIVLDGDRVFISTGYDVGCALLQVKQSDGKWTADALWTNKNLRSQFGNPVARDGHVYGLDMGRLVCLDLATGERKWKGNAYGHGQLLLSDDLLVIQGEKGPLYLAQASPEAFRQLGRIDVFDRKTWNLPALADGKVYLRNDEEMACFDLTAK
jgi:outer membrane protein assembly factor BamB